MSERPDLELLAATAELRRLANKVVCDVDEHCEHPLPCSLADPLANWLSDVSSRYARGSEAWLTNVNLALNVARAVNAARGWD